jgi:hypothetical protein
MEEIKNRRKIRRSKEMARKVRMKGRKEKKTMKTANPNLPFLPTPIHPMARKDRHPLIP